MLVAKASALLQRESAFDEKPTQRMHSFAVVLSTRQSGKRLRLHADEQKSHGGLPTVRVFFDRKDAAQIRNLL